MRIQTLMFAFLLACSAEPTDSVDEISFRTTTSSDCFTQNGEYEGIPWQAVVCDDFANVCYGPATNQTCTTEPLPSRSPLECRYNGSNDIAVCILGVINAGCCCICEECCVPEESEEEG